MSGDAFFAAPFYPPFTLNIPFRFLLQLAFAFRRPATEVGHFHPVLFYVAKLTYPCHAIGCNPVRFGSSRTVVSK